MNQAEEEARKDFEREELGLEVEDKKGEPLEHDWYWVSAFSQKCSNCGIIKEVLFDDNPIYRTRTAVKRVKEPKCFMKKPKRQNRFYTEL